MQLRVSCGVRRASRIKGRCQGPGAGEATGQKMTRCLKFFHTLGVARRTRFPTQIARPIRGTVVKFYGGNQLGNMRIPIRIRDRRRSCPTPPPARERAGDNRNSHDNRPSQSGQLAIAGMPWRYSVVSVAGQAGWHGVVNERHFGKTMWGLDLNGARGPSITLTSFSNGAQQTGFSEHFANSATGNILIRVGIGWPAVRRICRFG
jgi:hypothetical protein